MATNRPSIPTATELGRLTEILHGAQFAFLYGSGASGRLRGDSDVDIAVMYDRPLGAETVLRLAGEISAVFQRDADLLDLRRAGPVVKMQVLRYGEPVIVNDPGAFERFRMVTPSEYFDFKLSRRPIEAAMRAGKAP